MKAFADLYWQLDGTTSITEKVAALRDYFRSAPAADAACALAVLAGGRQSRAVPLPLLRREAAAAAAIPLWLLEECYAQTGDLAETLALVLPPADEIAVPAAAALVPADLGLAAHVERLRDLRNEKDEEAIGAFLRATWRVLAPRERIVWHKLLTGGCRVGVSRTLVARALAEVAGIEPAAMMTRLVGRGDEGAEAFSRLISPVASAADDLRPYPFFLAAALDVPAAGLGAVGDWQAEWKWDGIRAQVVVRSAGVALWTRGEDLATEAFPPFATLQRRSGRKRVTKGLLAEVPCVFVAYDLVEEGGDDLRALPLGERRARLERLLGGAGATDAPFLPEGDEAVATGRLFLSPLLAAPDWAGRAAARALARDRGVEGLILKRRASPYGSGRTRGDGWKWKIEPLEIDAVLLYAQAGHGRRAGLHTDYTLGVWEGEELVTVAKAYSGLSDAEIVEVDRIVRATTRQRHGPVRIVEPSLVFQIAFEGVAPSQRHKAKLALRFPRIVRWRRDKGIADAGRLDDLRRLCRTAAPTEAVP